MTENSGNNSSQESLLLSQETFNSLWDMMDPRGRAEMVAGIDAGYLQASAECGLVPPVQPQANSPHGAQSTRSSLPATCSWPGTYNFQLLFGTQEKVNKHINWTVSSFPFCDYILLGISN
ncbi:hypothetical protein AVEN_108439-1 [Araneus ventricosus]|uniref:Uncharacterized protein n=1 Tax=Araneus ventricosus TaxID=182803 RepID=A0A4Y2SFL8_ARAVE|nr:hypothetical protein AVEN_108439-1 [Araneus ventricosus]